jgi:hypothetical protein
MLVMAWVSTKGSTLDTAAEVSALQTVANDTGMELVKFVDEPLIELPAVLAMHKPRVFHFVGHGNKAGDLIMSDSDGNPQPVSTTDIARSLRAPAGGGVEGVVLNACHSGVAAHAVAPRGGWVVAMDATICDDAATEFARAFYSALVRGTHPAAAARAARAHLAATGYPQSDHVARLLPGVGYGYWRSRAPRDDERNRDAIQHVVTAFNRSAFRVPAIQEASFADLQDALNHTALALGTGQHVTRLAPSEPFSVLPNHLLGAPALRALSSDVAPLLDQARGILERLDLFARELGAEGLYLFIYNDLKHAGRTTEARTLLGLMNEMDAIRNRIMRRVNRLLGEYDEPHLPLMAKSSDLV